MPPHFLLIGPLMPGVSTHSRPRSQPRVQSSSPSPRPRSQPRIRSPSPTPRPRYPPDRLDAHIAHAITAYHRSTSWRDFIQTIRGRGDIHPDVATIPHPAGSLLDRFGTDGTPATMSGPPWDPPRIAAALQRGPHQSSHQGIDFLREEYADMMDKQQWTVLPASLIHDLPGLRLSPLGLFGQTLPRLLTKLHRANARFGPVYMSNIDLANGFYRVRLHPDDTMKLGVLFPSRPGDAPLIGIPLTNPMGWKSSPSNFCAFTETIADLANATLATGLAEARLTPHRLDLPSETIP
eukprot:jgi/Psemu1/27079/gm1.27079_g